ncbi:MAG: hypothetical protein HDQ88_10365 [Clostridia bacterium]|nr:hypothetical protein [Clostridia bacterium]
MAVAEMSKLNLVAMSYDRDRLLNALQKTGAVEVKTHYEAENTVILQDDGESLREYLNGVENALSLLCAEVDAYNKDNKVKSDELKDGFAVSYTQFMGAGELKEQCDKAVEEVNALLDKRRELTAEQAKLKRKAETAEIYSCVKDKLGYFANTAHAKVKLGVIPFTELDNLTKAVEECELASLTILDTTAESALIIFAYHKSEAGAEEILSSRGFVSCPFEADKSGEEIYAETRNAIDDLTAKLADISERLYALRVNVKPLKIYSDYLSFELEKITLSEKMRGTAKTFLLEAYLPKEAEEVVKSAIDETASATYYEFSEPADDEIPPTLYKNNAVVKNFETITNMYSPVNSKEFDPNAVMAFFYSLFLGFIMADVGYGLLMLLGGGAIYLKTRASDSGLKRLAGVFAIGGIFALMWGLLFNSVFGIPVFASSIIPDPQKSRWSLMGIQVPSVLIISMELGIVHLMTGYICKAIQCMRRGYFWDGILDGLVWAVFSIGMGLAIVGFVDEANISILGPVGGIMAGVSLLVAMLTAGRKEKLIGKFTKGFGAAYGIINYVSDILSYARLYGLMLSGAVIAQIISAYAVDPSIMNLDGVGFLVSGNPMLIILGVVLLVVGHGFNLAIGLLGAYIHDARLQYVEFYGRFFEGEGELFTPLGSNRKYIKVQNNL